MAELSYNTWMFTNVNKYNVEDDESSYTGILIADKLNQKNGQDYKLIDAIDIDWDGAWVRTLGYTYINTTEDLIEVLNTINTQDELGDLTKNVETLLEQLHQIKVSYVNHEELGDTLLSYQLKLTAGEHIGITDKNEVYAYGFPTYEYLGETYVTNSTFYDTLEEFNNIYAKQYEVYTKIETDAHIKKAINDVVDNADKAFDTLKEVADWIKTQESYDPVTKDYIRENPDEDYYVYNEETGHYTKVEYEDIDWIGDTQYYIYNSTVSDVSKIFKRLQKVETTVGDKTWDPTSYSYTYTGILYTLEQQSQWNTEVEEEISTLNGEISEAIIQSQTATRTANNAYTVSKISYNLAWLAYEASYNSSDLAYAAYKTALKASYDVGTPSIAEHIEELTQEEIELLTQEYNDAKENGTVYNPSITNTFYYYKESATFTDFNPNVKATWYKVVEKVEASGLTKRVEDVESQTGEIKQLAEEAFDTANQSLYNLNVDNSDSSYIVLSLHPNKYDGSPERTLKITTEEATVSAYTGEILTPGIPNIQTIRDCFSYASSWQYLDGEDHTINTSEE